MLSKTPDVALLRPRKPDCGRFLGASLFGDNSPSAIETQKASTDLPDGLAFRIRVKYLNKKYFAFSEA